jgi:predicted DNA-binding transcriptional regulator AlpA
MSQNGTPTLKAVPSLDALMKDPIKALDLPPEVRRSYLIGVYALLPVLGLPSEPGATIPVPDDALIGVDEVASLIGMSASWVEKHTDALPVRRSVEGNPRWLKSEVVAWVKARPLYGQGD